jgi:hypothetical protein
MNSAVSQAPIPSARSIKAAISPELALVDPVLAAQARESLAVPGSTLDVRPSTVAAMETDAALRKLAIAVDCHERDVPRVDLTRSRRVLGVVAASTIFAVLLLDVHVEVGRTPAAATSTKSHASVPAVSTAPPVSTPPRAGTSQPTSARRFAWAPVAGAESYRVELFRGEERVFAVTSPRPQLRVPSQWTYDGRIESLTSGEYRWYVWPIVDGKRAPRAVVQAQLALP